MLTFFTYSVTRAAMLEATKYSARWGAVESGRLFVQMQYVAKLCSIHHKQVEFDT